MNNSDERDYAEEAYNDPHQCDCVAPTCKDCGQPIRWTTDHWHHLTPLAVLRCTGTEAIEPAPPVHNAVTF